jgi:TRAP-type C4-dicarboxylate transport system permease small subunit
MKKLERLISRLLKYGTLISTLALILSVVVQIYARFFMDNAPSWTEEASRVFFIYAISFASGLAFKQHYYVFLDLISNRLNEKADKYFELMVNLLIFLLFLVIALYSIPYIQMGLDERSPSLGFNMAISFTSMFILGSSLCFYSFLKIFQLIHRKP